MSCDSTRINGARTRPIGTPSWRRCVSASPAAARSSSATKGFPKFLRTESGNAFVLGEEKVKEEARYDGHWVLCTNLGDEPEMIALAYREL